MYPIEIIYRMSVIMAFRIKVEELQWRNMLAQEKPEVAFQT